MERAQAHCGVRGVYEFDVNVLLRKHSSAMATFGQEHGTGRKLACV